MSEGTHDHTNTISLMMGRVLPEMQLDASAEDMEVEDVLPVSDQFASGDHVQILPPTKAEIQMADGDLVMTWHRCANHDQQCHFHVEIYETNDLVRTVKTYETELRIPRGEYSPIKYYSGLVCTVRAGRKSESCRAIRRMLCEKMGDASGTVYVDQTSPISRSHSVYIGYMKGVLDDDVAVKVVDVTEDMKNRFEREVQSLIKLGSLENVVTYRSSGNVKGFGSRYFIAMELCCKDNLKDMLEKGLLKGKPEEVKKVLLHIMKGLSCIHKKNILHRDLKLENVLRSKDKASMKICDFGLSKRLNDNKSKVSKSGTEIGTDGWGSPEHYGDSKTPMSKKSDIYSAGLIYCSALSEGNHAFGDKPYKWKSNIIENVRTGLPELKCDDPALAADLITRMLEFDPNNRPCSEDVLAHPFFWSNKSKLDFIGNVSSYLQDAKYMSHSIFKEIYLDIKRIAGNFEDWYQKLASTASAAPLCKVAQGEVRPFIPYNKTDLVDLIRFIRNIGEHHRQNWELVQLFNKDSDNVWIFFSQVYPNLLPRLFHIFYKYLPNMKEVRELSDIRRSLLAQPAILPLELP